MRGRPQAPKEPRPLSSITRFLLTIALFGTHVPRSSLCRYILAKPVRGCGGLPIDILFSERLCVARPLPPARVWYILDLRWGASALRFLIRQVSGGLSRQLTAFAFGSRAFAEGSLKTGTLFQSCLPLTSPRLFLPALDWQRNPSLHFYGSRNSLLGIDKAFITTAHYANFPYLPDPVLRGIPRPFGA